MVAMCRPVDWTRMPELLPQLPNGRRRRVAAGREMFVYPGSIEAPCTACRAAVWSGQRLPASGARPVCHLCLGKLGAVMATDGQVVPIINLHNPYKSADWP